LIEIQKIEERDLRYGIFERGNVRLVIFNILRQDVRESVNTKAEAGYFEHAFETASLLSGVYLHRNKAVSVNDPNNRYVQVKKMVLLNLFNNGRLSTFRPISSTKGS